MRKRLVSGLVLTSGILANGLGIAKPNVLEFPLEYRPTEVVGAGVQLDPSMLDLSVALEVADGRVGNDATRIGTRTDDDDRVFELRATNDVKGWLEEATRAVLADSGLAISEQSVRVLRITLVQLSVKEVNQAVGATYDGNIRLRFEVGARVGGSPGGVIIATGEATRYGKKFSADNANEVLGDAFISAAAKGLSDPVLHKAWSGNVAEEPAPSTSSPTAPSEAVGPPELLRQVQDLLEDGLGVETLLAYVRGRRLSRPLSAEDVVIWKEAGIPEEVVRAALELSTR